MLVLIMLLYNEANLTLGLTSSTLARAAGVAYRSFCEIFHNISRPGMIVLWFEQPHSPMAGAVGTLGQGPVCNGTRQSVGLFFYRLFYP